MMESLSSEQHELLLGLFKQINTAIDELREWNKGVSCANEYLCSSEGMRDLAASSMLLEAICEGIKRIDKTTKGELLPLRPEIPWKQVKGMRDNIAHGYFDIDAELIYTTIKEDLPDLKVAVEWFIRSLETRLL